MRSTQIPARRGLGGPRGLRLAGLALLVLVVSLGQGPTRARADEHADSVMPGFTPVRIVGA